MHDPVHPYVLQLYPEPVKSYRTVETTLLLLKAGLFFYAYLLFSYWKAVSVEPTPHYFPGK